MTDFYWARNSINWIIVQICRVLSCVRLCIYEAMSFKPNYINNNCFTYWLQIITPILYSHIAGNSKHIKMSLHLCSVKFCYQGKNFYLTLQNQKLPWLWIAMSLVVCMFPWLAIKLTQNLYNDFSSSWCKLSISHTKKHCGAVPPACGRTAHRQTLSLYVHISISICI